MADGDNAASAGRAVVFGFLGLLVLGSAFSCGDDTPSSSQGGRGHYSPSPVEIDTSGGGPIVPAPAPNLDYDPPGYAPGGDYYDTPRCNADITSC